jgi:hypothetical protein
LFNHDLKRLISDSDLPHVLRSMVLRRIPGREKMIQWATWAFLYIAPDGITVSLHHIKKNTLSDEETLTVKEQARTYARKEKKE